MTTLADVTEKHFECGQLTNELVEEMRSHEKFCAEHQDGLCWNRVNTLAAADFRFVATLLETAINALRSSRKALREDNHDR